MFSIKPSVATIRLYIDFLDSLCYDRLYIVEALERVKLLKNLKKLRLENNLTQEKLCKKLEELNCYMERSTYAKYERGNRKLPFDILIKLAEYYKTTTDYILGIADKK